MAANEQTEQMDTYEAELAWCVQQLENGLLSAKVKPTQKKADEAVKMLKVLRNPKAPKVKKRMVMRNKFGDYRKKMKQEEKNFITEATRVTLSTGSTEEMKSTYLRTCCSKQPTKHSTDPMTGTFTSSHSGDGDSSSFQFNFCVPTEESAACDKTTPCSDDSVSRQTADSSIARNFFKMDIGNSGFQFNFVPEDG